MIDTLYRWGLRYWDQGKQRHSILNLFYESILEVTDINFSIDSGEINGYSTSQRFVS